MSPTALTREIRSSFASCFTSLSCGCVGEEDADGAAAEGAWELEEEEALDEEDEDEACVSAPSLLLLLLM